MRYVIIAIAVYIIYLVLRTIVRNIAAKPRQNSQEPPKKKYDMNRIQDAEFREVKKD